MKFFTRLFLGGGSGPVALNKQFSFCCLTFILFLPSLFFAKKITAQFIATPPVINGVIAANEYGTHTNTNNPKKSGKISNCSANSLVFNMALREDSNEFEFQNKDKSLFNNQKVQIFF